MDEDCIALLSAWGLEEFIQNFKEERIDSGALSLLTDELAKELIRPIGPRAKFLANLREWRKVLQVTTNNLAEDLTFNLESQSTSGQQPQNEIFVDIPQQNPEDLEGQQSTPSPNVDEQSPELVKLLKSSNEGKALLQTAVLDNSSRSRLCDLIIGAELKDDPSSNVTSSRLMSLARQIITIFKKEHASTYFIPYINYGTHKKTAKGKLLNSLNKFRKRYRKIGLIQQSVKRRSSASSSEYSACDGFDTNTLWSTCSDSRIENEETNDKLLWLRNSTVPFETVVSYWKETSQIRLRQLMRSTKSINDYMSEYPCLTKPNGYVLLKEDFSFMYPDNDNKIIEEFPLLKRKIIDLGRKKSTHLKEIRTILQKYDLNTNPDLNEELSSYTAFSILPYLLAPNTINKGKKHIDKEKTTWRPSRSEIKDGFITEVASGDLEKTISERKQKLSRLGHSLQPFIVCIPYDGPNNDYFVLIEDTKYLFKDVVNAVDCCFKCIHALNAQYSPECSALWYFIQQAFYKLTTPWDKTYIGIKSLLSDLGIEEQA